MTARLRLIFTFYRRFIVMASIATLLLPWLMRGAPFGWLFVARLGISAGFVAITHYTYGNEYCYYRNRGVCPSALRIGSCALDMMIFVPVALAVKLIFT